VALCRRGAARVVLASKSAPELARESAAGDSGWLCGMVLARRCRGV